MNRDNEVSETVHADVDPITAFSYGLLDHVENCIAETKPDAATFSFGPLVFEMRVVGDVFQRRIMRAIDFARVPNARESVRPWRVLAIDGRTNGIGGPPYRLKNRQNLDRLHHCDQHQISVRYNPIIQTWSAVFGARRCAVIWAADAERMPGWDDAAPCRELFHWMVLPGECFLAHAAGIGFGGKGILLTGRSGSGKSTITATAVMRGMMTVGDDFVLVDPGLQRAHALYDSLKLDSQSASWLSELAAHAVNSDREAASKSIVHLSESHPSSLAHSLPIDAILLPTVGEAQKTKIVPATVAEAMRALVPSTVYLIRGGETETIRKSTSFLRKMPAYRCYLGSDPLEAIDSIEKFIADIPQ